MEDVLKILNVEFLKGISEMFQNAGAYGLAAFLLVAGLAVFLFAGKHKWAGVFPFIAGLFFAWVGIYIHFFYVPPLPPSTAFVHHISLGLDQEETSANMISDIELFQHDPRIWIESSTPDIRNVGGLLRHKWKAMAYDKSDISKSPNLKVRAVFVDKASDQSIKQKNYIVLSAKGKSGTKCTIDVKSDRGQEEGSSKSPFDVGCVPDDILGTSTTITNRGWAFRLVGSAFAQPATPTARQNAEGGQVAAVTAAGTIDASQLVVWYAKPTEAEVMQSALGKLAIPVVKKESALPQETNAVWVGADIQQETAHNVAKTLLEAGVKLQYFGPFSDPLVKSNLIEIGYSAQNQGKPVLTLEDIQKVKVGVPPFCYEPLSRNPAPQPAAIAASWRLWVLSPAHVSRDVLDKALNVYTLYDLVRSGKAENTNHGLRSLHGRYLYAFVDGRDYNQIGMSPKRFFELMGNARGVMSQNPTGSDVVDEPTGLRFINERGMLQLVERGEVSICQA